MSSVSKIVDGLGRKNLADALGVGETAVFNAVRDGVFPAKWYKVVDKMCGDVDIACPDSLFRFSQARIATDGQSPAPVQGGAS